MGQAKKRGTYEQRVTQSVERTEAEKAERAIRELERWNTLTPEQQHEEVVRHRQREERRQRLATLLGAVPSILWPY